MRPQASTLAATRHTFGSDGRRDYAGWGLAAAFAAALHILALLVPLSNPRQAPLTADSHREALVVRLIPPPDSQRSRAAPSPENPVSPSTATDTAGKAARSAPARSESRRAREPQSPVQPRIDRQANDATPAPGIDWQSDLRSLAPPAHHYDSGIARLGQARTAGAAEPASASVADALAAGAKRAERPDCRHAYASHGLLALPMLAIDTVRQSGCTW